jgi:hypothetical protein
MNDGRYRSVFHSPLLPADAYVAARDEMRAWLRSKEYDLARFDNGDPRVGPGAVLLHNSANSADGSQTWRWQLRESRDDGAWLSSLVVQAPAEPPANAATWFWVEVEFAPRDEAGETELGVRAGVPRLARGLLSRVESYDSLALLTNEPALVSLESVDLLIDVLCDPERRLPTVVASAHPVLDFEEWRGVVGRVTRYVPGLASIYLLDPLGTTAFGEGIGHSHAVWGGALRTYLPDVDPAVAEEALRHRVLSATRILADPGRAAGILSVLPRRLASEAPLPGPLAGVNRTLLTQTGSSPASSSDGEAVRSQVAALIEERELALILAEDQEARANAFFEQRESALAELIEREQRVLDLENLVGSLRKRLVADGRASEAYLPADEPAAPPPATFAELLDWVETDLALIDFTGDRQALLTLDRSPESSTWVRSSWEVLRALQSYADAKLAKTFAGDFKMWCEKPPSDSYVIPAGKVARDESETVRNNAKWRREREFPVPAKIDPSQQAFMGAHIRIGASASGQISPRLYFYDATAPTGKIYVGYLGRHLTNTRT